MSPKELKAADDRNRKQLRMLSAMAGSNGALAKLLGLSEATLYRRMAEPGELTINEYRRMMPLAKQLGIVLDPLGVVTSSV